MATNGFGKWHPGKKAKTYFVVALSVLLLICAQGFLWAQSIDLSGQMTPVKHQGQRNTCSAFAATALMEFLLLERTGVEFDLSESYTFFLGKTKALTTPYTKEMYSSSDGLAGFLALKAFEYGCMVEQEWPYEAANWFETKDPRCTFDNGRPNVVCFTGRPPHNAQELPYRIVPVFIEPENLGRYLLEHKKPIVYNVQWYTAAVDHQTGIFHLPSKEEMAMGGGGHVILLVGYDAQTRTFVFRNSWGPQWGNNGYGTMPEEYILQHGEACQWKPFDRYPPEVKEFLEIGIMGASAVLEED